MGLIKSSFYDTELTKTTIDYSKLAQDATPFKSVMADIQEYLAEKSVEKFVKRRRKHILYVEPLVSNKLMLFLFEKYSNDRCVTKVDIFDAVTSYLDVEEADFFESLTDKIKMLLKKSLKDILGQDINLDADKKELKTLGFKQVDI